MGQQHVAYFCPPARVEVGSCRQHHAAKWPPRNWRRKRHLCRGSSNCEAALAAAAGTHFFDSLVIASNGHGSLPAAAYLGWHLPLSPAPTLLFLTSPASPQPCLCGMMVSPFMSVHSPPLPLFRSSLAASGGDLQLWRVLQPLLEAQRL